MKNPTPPPATNPSVTQNKNPPTATVATVSTYSTAPVTTTPQSTHPTPSIERPNPDDRRGITSQRFSRDEIIRIQNQWDNDAHRGMRDVDPFEDEDWVYDDDYDGSGYVSSFVTGMKSWYYKKKEKVVRDDLKRQVEEQLAILRQRKEEEDAALTSRVSSTTDCGRVKVGRVCPSSCGDGVTVSLEVEEQDPLDSITVSIIPDRSNVAPILSSNAMRQIVGKGLPASLIFSKWKRLYCLSRDGDSFEQMIRMVKGHQKTLLVVKSTRGDIFGGFADAVWEVQHSHEIGGGFYGTGRAMLFRVEREGEKVQTDGKDDNATVQIYKWTGVNRYIQLCDFQKKTLAMGGGGNDGSFGLCIEDDFRRGSTGHCETFNNEPLTNQEEFDVLELEIWGFQAGEF